MAAVQGLPAPLVSDFGLLDEFLLPVWEEMHEQTTLGDWSLESSYETLPSRSEVAKSPGKQTSHSLSSGNSAASHSPGGASQILTPSSTSLLDLSDNAGYEDQNSDMMSASPNSNVSPGDGFVHVHRDNRHRPTTVPRSTRPPPAAPSGVWSSFPPSHASRTSHTSRESSVSRSPHGNGGQWQPFIPSSTVLMDDQNSARQNSYQQPLPNHLLLSHHGYAAGHEDLLSNIGGFDGSNTSYSAADSLPFRPVQHDGSPYLNYHAASLPPRTSAPYSTQAGVERSSLDPMTQYTPYNSIPSYNSPVNPEPQFGYHPSFQPYEAIAQGVAPSSRSHHAPSMVYNHATSGTTPPNFLVPSNAPDNTMVQQIRSIKHSPSGTSSQSPIENTPVAPHPQRTSLSNNSIARYPTLVKPRTSPSSAGSQRPSPGITKPRRGGRPKDSHLPEDLRAKSHRMRKVGACWRCAMQRDPCDHGSPCNRCLMRSQRGQQYFFDCDRSKLPDFVHDFLPPSMTVMHQKQTIEDCVHEQVFEWVRSSGMDIYLNSGYGPPLRWKVFEFKPRTEELLWQLQYFQNPATGQSIRHEKYSPPLGLMKFDTSDIDHFEAYLNELLLSEHLCEFGANCYEEESQVDEGMFQALVLDLLCKLYQGSSDNDLKEILRNILRMLIITYIMGHTLTISHDTLPTVLSSVQHSARPAQAQAFTSPRLANRQLKFFFAIQRESIYKNVLRWQQATLHQAGKKESTWLSAFCVMLGFAMVLEEVQRTLQIQADAKANKGEMTPAAATTEAYHACDRIDQRYKLLIGLFQCKYRDRKWGENGSFGPGTPELRDPHAREFLNQLKMLVDARHDHLRVRESVAFAPENQCLYTTRLTARFLLPFLSLPNT